LLEMTEEIGSGGAYRVTGIAVCRAIDIVNPAPIGVNDNRPDCSVQLPPEVHFSHVREG
jgi:hypothetical protein